MTILHPDHQPPKGHLLRVNSKNYIVPGNKRVSQIELIRASEMMQEYRIQAARVSFGAFMEYCFIDELTRKPFEQQWFHDEWSEAWDKQQRSMVIAPRNHGKTSQIVGRVIWELGRNHNLRIKISCAADGRAKERLFEIVQHIVHNERIHEVFPDLKQDKSGEWSRHKIIIQRTARHRDASVEAIGITATVTGGRCDLLIADDVVDRRNALSFPKLRTQIKQAWKSDWTNLLEPDSRVWYICTMWHKDDLSHELMDNPMYHVLFYAIPKDFGSMWVSKWPTEHLIDRFKEIGSIQFNRGFRNKAVDEESAVIRDVWIQYSDLANDEHFLSRVDYLIFFTSYDPARATGEENDYSACVVIAVDPDEGHVYIIDAWHDKLTVGEQSGQVWKEHLKFRPFRILIEKVGLAVLDEWVLNEHPELINTIEVTTPKVSKHQRLIAITPLLEQGNVTFSEHLNPQWEHWNPARERLVHELLDFPFAQNDDCADAFSQALAAARRYFLDDWAIGNDTDMDVRIGASGNDDDGYLF